MAEFLISKQDARSPVGWRPIVVVTANVPSTADEYKDIVRQGFEGPGRYAVARWDNRREHDLRPGPVDAFDPA